MTTGELQEAHEIDGFVIGPLEHEGGMGQLFRVTRRGESEPLLMKVPRLAADVRGDAVVSFETERMVLPLLCGPHVPAFVAAGEMGVTPYLVMQYVPGVGVETLIEAGPVAVEEVARVGAAVADALHSVHQQDAIHLDVKPANVILRPDGLAVLVDFGFAHHAGCPDLLAEETRFGAGSAPYVSPEQLLGSRDDRRSDVFALGVMLYEIATGCLPFGEPDTDVRNRLWFDPRPPSVIVPSIPAWLQEVILRCIEVHAEVRYRSAAHVAFDLRNPEQIELTHRATKRSQASLFTQWRRFLRARAELGAMLRRPQPLKSSTPIVLVAVDTSHLDDPRHPELRVAVTNVLAQSKEFRLVCLSVIRPTESNVEHVARLKRWVAPFELPMQRLSLHVMESETPAEIIVEFARHNNVDLIIIGAPGGGTRTWIDSTASSVTAQAQCSVQVVRVPLRSATSTPESKL